MTRGRGRERAIDERTVRRRREEVPQTWPPIAGAGELREPHVAGYLELGIPTVAPWLNLSRVHVRATIIARASFAAP